MKYPPDMPEFPRPNDHPSQLPWPPALPDYPADSPARKEEITDQAFNHDQAINSFGSHYIQNLKRNYSNYEFKGDWWLLALLCRSIEMVHRINADNPCGYEFWNKTVEILDASDCRGMLHRAQLSGKDMRNISFLSCKFYNAKFSNSKFDSSNFHSTIFYQCEFDNSSISDILIQRCLFDNCLFKSCNGNNVTIVASTFQPQCQFKHARMPGLTIDDSTAKDANFEHADLSSSRITNSSFIKCGFSFAKIHDSNLSRTDFSSSTFFSADLRRTDFSRSSFKNSDISCVKIDCSNFKAAKGLYGNDKATTGQGPIDDYQSQNAIYTHNLDKISWECLRFISSLKIFGISYFSVLLIVTCTFFIKQYNSFAESSRSSIKSYSNTLNQTSSTNEMPIMWAAFISGIPSLPIPVWFGLQLLATIVIAVAATIYTIWCPAEIKEANEVQWTRAMGQPVWEYRSASWSNFIARYACCTLFLISGGYTLFYLLWHICQTLLFIFIR